MSVYFGGSSCGAIWLRGGRVKILCSIIRDSLHNSLRGSLFQTTSWVLQIVHVAVGTVTVSGEWLKIEPLVSVCVLATWEKQQL